MRKVSILLFVAFLTLTSTAWAVKLTGVKGKVIDAITGKPVSEAKIIAITETNLENEQKFRKITTKTDKSGSFYIKGLASSNYFIDITKDGYIYGTIGQWGTSKYGKEVVYTPYESNKLLEEPYRLYPYPKRYTFAEQTALDNETGLMWLRKIVYIEGNGAVPSVETLISVKNEFNQNKFAGYDDWRLPTINEVMDLLYYYSKYISNPNSSSSSTMVAMLAYGGFYINDHGYGGSFCLQDNDGTIAEIFPNESGPIVVKRFYGGSYHEQVFLVRKGK